MKDKWTQQQKNIHEGLSSIGKEIAGFYEAGLNIYYGNIIDENHIIDFHEYNEFLYGKIEPPFSMSIPVYQADIEISGGAIISIDNDGWRWSKGGKARGVAKEDQNILKEFGLKRRKSY